MKNDETNIISFDSLQNDEKFYLCKTISRIFAIRLLKSEHPKFFLGYHDGSIHIEVGHVENFTRKGGYGTCRYGWIPDEKFKVKTSSMGAPNYIVWLDLKFGEEDFFEKEKRDIMNWMLSENPSYRILSGYITVDKVSIQNNFAILCITTWQRLEKDQPVFYSSVSDFNDLSTSERGEVGESLGKIFTKRLLYEHQSFFFPDIGKDFLRLEEGVSIDFSKTPPKYFAVPETHWERLNTADSWMPDTTLQVLSNPDKTELKYEMIPKKIVYLEVKTGKNARLERYQQNDIEAMSHAINFIILVCHIIPDYIDKSKSTMVSKLVISFQIVKDGGWGNLTKFYYSDFQDMPLIQNVL